MECALPTGQISIFVEPDQILKPKVHYKLGAQSPAEASTSRKACRFGGRASCKHTLNAHHKEVVAGHPVRGKGTGQVPPIHTSMEADLGLPMGSCELCISRSHPCGSHQIRNLGDGQERWHGSATCPPSSALCPS